MKKCTNSKRARKGCSNPSNAKVFDRKQANGNKKGDEGRAAPPVLSIPLHSKLEPNAGAEKMLISQFPEQRL